MAAGDQQLHYVLVALVVELSGAARTVSEVVHLVVDRGIEEAIRRERAAESVITPLALRAAILDRGVVILHRADAKVESAVSVQALAGARGDIEDAAEAVPEFRREAAGDQVHRFEDLLADPGSEAL